MYLFLPSKIITFSLGIGTFDILGRKCGY